MKKVVNTDNYIILHILPCQIPGFYLELLDRKRMHFEHYFTALLGISWISLDQDQ